MRGLPRDIRAPRSNRTRARPRTTAALRHGVRLARDNAVAVGEGTRTLWSTVVAAAGSWKTTRGRIRLASHPACFIPRRSRGPRNTPRSVSLRRWRRRYPFTRASDGYRVTNTRASRDRRRRRSRCRCRAGTASYRVYIRVPSERRPWDLSRTSK